MASTPSIGRHRIRGIRRAAIPECTPNAPQAAAANESGGTEVTGMAVSGAATTIRPARPDVVLVLSFCPFHYYLRETRVYPRHSREPGRHSAI